MIRKRGTEGAHKAAPVDSSTQRHRTPATCQPQARETAASTLGGPCPWGAGRDPGGGYESAQGAIGRGPSSQDLGRLGAQECTAAEEKAARESKNHTEREGQGWAKTDL